MAPNREIVEQMYQALRRRDATRLAGLLDPHFVGRTSPGLPYAGGRTATGPAEMLSRVWGEIHRHYDVTPQPEALLETADDTVVGLGTYRGSARATGEPFEAWFVHLWTVRDGRVVALRQITDTVPWAAALQPAPAPDQAPHSRPA